LALQPFRALAATASLAAFALGCAAALSWVGIFFVTPYSRLFPSILVPALALALGAFIAVRWSGPRRSAALALVALIPALALPAYMVVQLLLRGEALNGWPGVALGACVIASAAGWVALLRKQDYAAVD
jgi:hypothetical protein